MIISKDFIVLNVEFMTVEKIVVSVTASRRYAGVTKRYITCGQTGFVT